MTTRRDFLKWVVVTTPAFAAGLGLPKLLGEGRELEFGCDGCGVHLLTVDRYTTIRRRGELLCWNCSPEGIGMLMCHWWAERNVGPAQAAQEVEEVRQVLANANITWP